MADNRRNDDRLDASIDDESFAELDMRDPSGGKDGLMGNFGSDKPVKPTSALLVEAAKGAAEGLGDAVYEDMEREMPNVASIVTELSDTYQDFKDLKDEIAKQITPMVTSMENIGRKILPRVEKLMPKSWYESAKKTLDRRAEERRSGRTPSEQELRDQSVASELGSIFGEGGSKQALAQAEHNEREHKKERMFDLSMQATRNKTYVKYLASIYDSLRSTELFHRTLHTAYMKKDLELKYKHLFIAQDTYNLLSTSMSAFEGYFKGVVHNTALPDSAKAQAIEKRRTSKYGALIGDFLTNARKNVMNKLKNTVKDVLGNVQFALSSAEAIPEEYEMADQMAEMGEGAGAKGLLVRKASKALTGLLARGPSRALFQRFAPYLSFINGPDNDIKERGYLALNKLRNRMAGSGVEWQRMIAEFLPTMNVDVAGSNDLLTHGEDGAQFDRLTRQSIVEIIPGYLKHIHTSIEQIRTGDANAEGLVYNIHRRRFTSAAEAREDAYNDSMMFGGNENQTEAVKKVLSTIHVGMEYNKEGSADKNAIHAQQQTISRILANHSLTQANFLPEKIIAFASNPERRKNDAYIKNIGAGIKMEDLVAACKMLKSAMIGNDGRLNKDIVARLESATISAMRGTDGFKTRLPTYLESFGMRDLLAGGYKDKNGNVVEGIVNDDNSLSKTFIAKRMSKHNVEDAAAYGYSAKNLADYMNKTRVVDARVKRMTNQFREGNYWDGITGFGTEITDHGHDININPEDIDGVKQAKRMTAEEKREARKRKKKQKQQKKKKTTEKIAEAATGTTEEEQPGFLKRAFRKIKSKFNSTVDKLQTKEGAEEFVNDLQDDAADAWANRPKDWEDFKKKSKAEIEKLRKDHPELAKKWDAFVAKVEKKKQEISNNRIVKAGVNLTGVVAGKIKGAAADLYKEYGKKAVDDATNYVKTNIMPHINKATKKGDRARRYIMLAMKSEKIRAKLKKDLGAEWTKLETSVKNKATDLAEESPSWLGTKFKGARESIGGWFGKFKEAAGIEDTAEESKEGEEGDESFLSEKSSRVSDKATVNIYKLLKVWHKEFKTAANALAHDTGYITAQLNSQLKASGAEPVKDPGMSKYGIFGRGGYVIGRGITAVASGAWKATSFMAGVYGKVLGAGAKLVAGVPGALGYVGKSVGALTGMNPYMDVYVKGREDEGVILSWRKQAFGKGVIFKDGTRVKATKEIDRPVYDPETGNELLSEADVEAGLWSPGLFSGTFKVASTLAKGVAKGIGAYYGGLGKAAMLIAGGLFGTRGEKDEKYIDIYRKDEIGGGYQPILTRLKQERDPGVVFKNGERVERSSDIHEPVYDPVSRKKLIDENDIKHGLVNVHNRPIGTGSKAREGLVNMLVGGAGKLGSGIAKRLFGETGMKVLGAAGMGLVGIYKGFFNTIFGAGNAAVSGISKLGARLFGFDSPGGFGKQAFEGLNTRLDKLIELTTGILNKMGGEVGGGSGGGGEGTTGTSGEHINPATGEPIINKSTVYDSGLSGEELDKLHKETDWRKKKEQGGSGSGGSWLTGLLSGAIGSAIFGGTAASRAAKIARAKKAADALAKKKDMGLIQRKLLEKRAVFRRRMRMFNAQRGKRLSNVKNYIKNIAKFKGLPEGSKLGKMARAAERLKKLGGGVGTFLRNTGTRIRNLGTGARTLLGKIPGVGRIASLAGRASPALKATGRVLGKFAGPALAALESGLAMYNTDETIKKAAEKGIGMSPEERQMREMGMDPHNPDDIEKYKAGRESGEIPNPVGIMDRLGQGAAGAIDAFNVLGWFNDDMKVTNMLGAFQAGADENGLSVWGALTGANDEVIKANEEMLKSKQKLGKTKAEALNKILARLGAPLKEVYGDKLTPLVLVRMYHSYLKSAGIKMDRRDGDYKILSNKEIQNGFAEYCKKQAADKKEGKAGEADKHIQDIATAKARQEAKKQKAAEKAKIKAAYAATAPAGDLVGKKTKKGGKLSISEMIDQFIEEKGYDVCKNMPYTEFKNAVEDYVDKLTEGEHNISELGSSAHRAGLESIFHYARLHGITDKKLSVRMGELIDPRTGKPVVRDNAANEKRHAEDRAKEDDEWVSKMAKGQFATKSKGSSWTPSDVFFKEYIDSVGGLKKVADMDRDTFIKGCAEYVNSQELKGRSGYFGNEAEESLSRWKDISGMLYDKITANNQSSSKSGKLAPLKQAASVAFSTALSAAPMAAAAQADIVKEPAPVVQTVSQTELNENKLKTQAELVASKINATKSPVDNRPTEKVSKGVDKLNDSMSDLADNMAPLKTAIGKDGMLHIAGMDQLLYITANKPVASGGTQVINNTIVREANEGLDLRRKQW